MKQLFLKLLLSVTAALLAVGAFAQVTTSSMSGKVSDKAGALAGATVVAVHQPTGSQYYAVTDAKGYYRLHNITAGGPYKVTFSCLGYSEVTYTDIRVALSDNAVIDAEMKEESLQIEAVTVSAESRKSNMRSDRAGALTSLDAKEIMNVPTVTRSMNDLLKQTPQAYVSGTKAYIGGGSYRDSYVTVDGAAMNNAFGIGSNLPAGGSPISLDALDQVAIAITPFDVRQSGFTGGGINATTKSGTNEFHATAYGYFKNQDFQGYQVADYTPLSKTDSRYLMYGVSVGGPIIKDKLFFFVNFEDDKTISPGPTRKLSERADQGGKLVDTGTVFTTGNDGVCYPSAVVLDALHDYLLDKYGYETGPYNNYNYETPSSKLLARIDWNINQNHKFNIRYNMVKSKYGSAPSTSTTGFGNSAFSTSSATAMYALYYQNARYYQEQNYSSVAAELNSRFLDGKLGNTLRVSYAHQYEPRSVDGGYFPFVDFVLNDVNGDGKTHIYTTVGTEAFSYGNLRDVRTMLATDEINLSLGRHDLLAGVQYEWDNTKNGFQRMGAGAFVFDYANEQAFYDAIKGGTLFDKPQQFAITHGNNATFAQEFPNFTFGQLSFYLQDTFNVSDNFKLTAGVRFELPSYPSLDFNRNAAVERATFAPTVNNPSGKYNTVDMPATRLSFSPRIGFNWDILGNRKLVMRGGTGVFVGRIPFVWIVGQSGDAGVLQTTVTRYGQACPTVSTDRNAMLNQIYPGGFSAVTAGENLNSITLMDPQLKNPTTWKSSLALDVMLPGDIKASIEGIYKKDIHSVTLSNIALKAPTSLISVPDIEARPYWCNGYTDNQITSAYLVNNVSGLAGNGYYYAITAKLEKSFSWGLNVNVSYTNAEAKTITDGVGDQPGSAWKGLVSQRGTNSQELGYASYVLPHRVVANVSYSKDYAKYFGSVVSISYFGGAYGRSNVDYVSNVFGDGAYNYSLIDIPTLSDLQSASGAWGQGDWKFKDNGDYTAAQQAEDCWTYIQSDKYLKNHTGKVAERFGVVSPWVHTFDFKYNQNFYVYTGKSHHKNTFQLGVDIQNAANLLNPFWGNSWTINCGDGYGNTTPLNLTNAKAVYTQGEKPVFQFQKNGSERMTNLYSRYNGFSSTWEMILSLRYIF